MGTGKGKGCAGVACPVLCMGVEAFPDLQHCLVMQSLSFGKTAQNRFQQVDTIRSAENGAVTQTP